MPTVIPDGYAQISFVWTLAGSSRPAFTIFGVQDESALTATEVCEAIAQNWRESLQDASCGETVLSAVRYHGGDDSVAEVAVGEAGAASGDQAPPNVTYLISKLSGIAGRENQGRMYLPGVPEGEITAGGSLDGSFRSGVQDVATDFLEKMAADSLPLVILHNGVGTPTQLTQLVVQTKVATQRHRLRS